MTTPIHPFIAEQLLQYPEPRIWPRMWRGEHVLPSESKIARKRRSAKKLLKKLQGHLYQKWAHTNLHLGTGCYDRVPRWWGATEAADAFAEQTGCTLEAATRYFGRFEHEAEWETILNRPIVANDYNLWVASRRIRLPP